MDETWQNSLSEFVARAVLARALEDLKEARDRLNQNPSNSSRPPGSVPYWDKSGVEEDEADLDPPRTDSGANEAATEAGESNPSASQDTSAKALSGRKPGKQKGAPSHGRTQKFAIHAVVDHHPAQCAACSDPLRAEGEVLRPSLLESPEAQSSQGLSGHLKEPLLRHRETIQG